MHVVFVHKNHPAQFGHVARHLVARHGWRCTFVSETPAGDDAGVRKIQYQVRGGATRNTHYCSRTFENAIWHAAGVHEALRPLRDELAPDLIVGHSGFGSTLFLPELFPAAPVINYFEYYYRPHGSDLDYRPEWPVPEANFLRSRARNAMILLDLESCAAGYSPTEWQRSLLPASLRGKVRTLHDGIDTAVWRRHEGAPRAFRGREFGPRERVVTYVSRGFESMRGFDIFMRVAGRICRERPDVHFVVVGSDRVCYGGDLAHIPEKSFREHVLNQGDYDLSRFTFPGRVPAEELARLLSISDLHVYLTVPFVLSWSMLNAMACGCVVLGSRTPPVEEFLRDGENGLLEGFFDVEALTARALAVLDDPARFRPLGDAAAELIRRDYSVEVLLPRLVEFYTEVARGARPAP